MADISIPYDRQFTDADLSAIVARATATINVMQQLGATYQSLPGYEMAGYQTESDSLEGEVTAVQGLADQIKTKLIAIDQKAAPLKVKNEGTLGALRGLLKSKAGEDLLSQITGPQPSGGGNTPTPPPPNP